MTFKFRTFAKLEMCRLCGTVVPKLCAASFVRGAAKACESCCTYCFSHNNCSVKVASSNVPSKSFFSVRGMKAV